MLWLKSADNHVHKRSFKGMIEHINLMKSSFLSLVLRQPFTLIVLGLLVGTFFSIFIASKNATTEDKDCVKEYVLTNKNLDCEEYTEKYENLQTLKAATEGLVNQALEDGHADRVSVWVRDLETNQNFGINEQEIYSPGSLLKVPLLLAYYKVAEIKPNIFEVTIEYNSNGEDLNTGEYFKPEKPILNGEIYTVEELLRRAIIDSDNNAALILYSYLAKDYRGLYEKTVIDFHIRIPNDISTINYLTARTYANIFRSLYNASYLNRDSSEKVLEILSETNFNRGLRALVPESITVAHKFGERFVVSKDPNAKQKSQLHDCGIVYKKSSPYSICIMTDGKNFTSLVSVIQDISKLVYENI
jgi:beta-lactamase class A